MIRIATLMIKKPSNNDDVDDDGDNDGDSCRGSMCLYKHTHTHTHTHTYIYIYICVCVWGGGGCVCACLRACARACVWSTIVINKVQLSTLFAYPYVGSQAKVRCTQAAAYWTLSGSLCGDGSGHHCCTLYLLTALSFVFTSFSSLAARFTS